MTDMSDITVPPPFFKFGFVQRTISICIIYGHYRLSPVGTIEIADVEIVSPVGGNELPTIEFLPGICGSRFGSLNCNHCLFAKSLVIFCELNYELVP